MRWPWISKSAVLERLETVERGLRSLQAEWLEEQERLQRKIWRAAKQKGPPGAAPDDAEPPEPMPRALGARPGPDPISQRILAQRRIRFSRSAGDT